MKKLSTRLTLSAIAICVSASAFAGAVAQNKVTDTKLASVQTVVVQAKRMSAEEKAAYDLSLMQNQKMQVVEIRAKRLTAAQKAAMAVK